MPPRTECLPSLPSSCRDPDRQGLLGRIPPKTVAQGRNEVSAEPHVTDAQEQCKTPPKGTVCLPVMKFDHASLGE